jgi:hypothetical protein
MTAQDLPIGTTAPIPDNPFWRRMAAGHRIRLGHDLAGVHVYGGGGIWHLERSCCDSGE